MTEPVQVAYFFDAGFRDCTLVSLVSMARATRRRLAVSLFPTGLDAEALAPFQALPKLFGHLTVTVRDIDSAELATPISPNQTGSTFGRLLLPGLCEGRVIYVDGDTLILDDIGQLWDMDLQGHPVAAATDAYLRNMVIKARQRARLGFLRENAQLTRRVKELGRPVVEQYFNAGIMVYDCAAIRDQGLAAPMADMATAAGYALADQDHLNTVFCGRWADMGLRWNCTDLSRAWSWRMSRALSWGRGPSWRRSCLEACRTPGLVHFAGQYKPWAHNAPRPLKAKGPNPIRDAVQDHYAAFGAAWAEVEDRLGLRLFRVPRGDLYPG